MKTASKLSLSLFSLILRASSRVIASVLALTLRLVTFSNKLFNLDSSPKYIFVAYSYNNYMLVKHVLFSGVMSEIGSTELFLIILSNRVFSFLSCVDEAPLDPYLATINKQADKNEFLFLNSIICLSQVLLSSLSLKPILFVVPHVKPMGFCNLSHIIAYLPLRFLRFYDDGLSGLIVSSSTRKYIPASASFLFRWEYKFNTPLRSNSFKNYPPLSLDLAKDQFNISPTYSTFAKSRILRPSILSKSVPIESVSTAYCIVDSKYFDMTRPFNDLWYDDESIQIYHYIHPVIAKRSSIDSTNFEIHNNVSSYTPMRVPPEEHVIYLLQKGYFVKLYCAHTSVPFFIHSLVKSGPPSLSNRLRIIPSFHNAGFYGMNEEEQECKEILFQLLSN